MNAMKPILTVSLGVPTDSLSRRLNEEGIIYRWQQAASEQLLLVDSESNSERIAELIHDWRLEQSLSAGHGRRSVHQNLGGAINAPFSADGFTDGHQFGVSPCRAFAR